MAVVLLKEDRKNLIINQLNLHTRISLSDLAQILHVSEDTIRRDINDLAEEGKLIRIRGGAMSKAYHYNAGPVENYSQEQKARIAEKAAGLVKEGMLVLIGGGTTIREFIRAIPDDLQATFLTVNPLTAVELLDKPLLEIILIGGPVSRHSRMTVGADVGERLSEIRADLCVMGTTALDAQAGMTDSHWETVQTKKAMIRAAKKTAVLSISEKMNSVLSLKVADLRDIDYVVTELPPDSPGLAPYREAGTTLL